jgi:alginate O-acetyltransferase complex protein AlgI
LRKVELSDVTEGLLRVAVGFFKKVVIADNLTLYINYAGPQFAHLVMTERWCVLIAIAFRIYMDFSGYSDMAIGFSRMLGIPLPRNFHWPYGACNIQEFWQRWHISLSTWIRDYVYIPLGGNRCGFARRIINGLLAFGLCGLWHGAAWNFIVWGLYHGVGLAVCSSYRTTLGSLGRGIGALLDRVPVVSWAVTMLFVGIGWLLFFYPIGEAVNMTRLLFVSSI